MLINKNEDFGAFLRLDLATIKINKLSGIPIDMKITSTVIIILLEAETEIARDKF